MNGSGGFENFCGGKFWDIQLTWNTSSPDFTSCFQKTVIVWAPCAFLWLTLPPYSYVLSTVTGNGVPVTRLNKAKTVIGVLQIILCLINLFVAVGRQNNGTDIPKVDLVTPAILAATLILSTILVQVERKKGFITSGIQFLFWILQTILFIIPFYSKIKYIQDHGEIEDLQTFIVFYIYYAFTLLQLILSCFAEKNPNPIILVQGRPPCPETEASFISRVTFWWMTGLVYLGYKKTLEEDDLWSPNPRDISRNTAPILEKTWKKELEYSNWFGGKTKVHPLTAGSVSQMSGSSKEDFTAPYEGANEKTPLFNGQNMSEVKIVEGKVKEPSLFKVLVKVFGPTMLIAHCCKLVCDILTFIGPTLQQQLIGWTEDKLSPLWKGYLFAALFFASAVLNSFFFHQLFHIGMTLGMRVKASMIAAVYKKALTMSNEARKNSTVGEIVNLMSVDAQRLQDATGYLWMVWSAPLQIIIAVYLLWGILGPSVLGGLAVMVLLIPVNGVLSSYQRKLQILQMKKKDDRIKLMNEILNGMKVLKLYAWELSFREKVNVIRNFELDTLKKYAYLSAFGTFTWTCAPFLVTLATFAAYVLSGNPLDASKAFVSLSLFNILRFPINLLPMMISYLVTASVSIKRIGNFLRQGDIDLNCVQHDQTSTHPITIERGTFAWGTTEDDVTALKGINFSIRDGQLVAVVGQVGCGKSSLISAILGEMEKLGGKVNVRGSIAYVAQQAWIQNATLRDNILFGKDFDANRYNQVLEACALKPDLEILPGGDMTEIGEKGINLSGGQKQRISLARAVYNDADIYLMDDPLSAVDSHVGKHIFENVVGEKGMLKGKTRILVTHGVHWLPNVDQIVVMVNGEITEVGSYDELMTHNGAFAQFLKTYLSQVDSEDEDSDPELSEIRQQILQRVDSINPESTDVTSQKTGTSATSEGEESGARKRKRSRKSLSGDEAGRRLSRQMSRKITDVKDPDKPEKKDNKLIQEEKSATGQVKFGVFFEYCKSLGGLNTVFIAVCFLIYQASLVASNIWLSRWTEDPTLKNSSVWLNSTLYLQTRDMYLGVYGALGGSQAFFVLLYAIVTAISMVRASRILHSNMLYNILRSPMHFFDTTPIGRILNRFSRDIETIDNVLPNLLRSWLNTFFGVMSTIIVISYSTPIFLSVVIPLTLLYYFVQRFYIPTSRQLKRIESTTRSPIYVHFSETITGASTIRAYGYQDRFISQSEYKVDHNLVFYFSSIASNRWLGFRLEFVGASVVLTAALFAVIGRGTLSGGLVGLSISYALQATQSLNWMVRMTSDLETNIVSVERVKEYSETEQEADWQIQETRPPPRWPHEGRVAMEDYCTRYREGLDLVLRGITFNVKGGEKVGIVGRTGAGKSSLTLSLFRIIEAAGGAIFIDGIQIATMGLHQLRSKITILPQDPVLFSGTLRMNLDPFDNFRDDEIWIALEHAHLKEFIQGLPQGLSYECGEGGQNLSVGQRQLVCLARTLLRKTKILVLDEATAAVDLETDELIQNTIRTEFADCTVLTIAHRLNTIMDNDRVMVLDAGKISEFDSPANLLKSNKSAFYGMAKDAGLVS